MIHMAVSEETSPTEKDMIDNARNLFLFMINKIELDF